jgi:carbon monoxide dehydrogenase subunit G
VVEGSAVIDAPPERVWEVVSDPHNLHRWDRRIAAVEGVPKDGLHVGATYTVVVRFMGAKAHATSRVVEFKPGTYSKVKVTGMVDAVVETWLEPLSDGRTRLRHRVDYHFPGGPLGELAAGAVKMLGAATVLRRGVEAQKRQAEHG